MEKEIKKIYRNYIIEEKVRKIVLGNTRKMKVQEKYLRLLLFS